MGELVLAAHRIPEIPPDAQTKGKQGAMEGIETRLYNDGEGSFSCKNSRTDVCLLL
jgi:hypothetical protein